MESPRCQSCGQPLSVSNFGTNASGTYNEEYCSMCFQKGQFTDSDITLSQMMQISASHMVNVLHMNENEAKSFAIDVIPTLKRWKNMRA
ncbi:MAG: zinc ribbon domain-containing protein [Candidatus Levybacteria bacterium]|nr:zinc ribbon domain-containing protein [Candidatus Levybacteria bacterium]MBP9814748.1 zinc ribbon domain-containing protein [Candidatus Levybacteria bacterium]